jgi:hypothetical protein
MATVFDLSVLEQFSGIFALLFVWVVIYAVLQLTKALGANKNIDALIAFVVAVFFGMSPKLTQALATMTPWFVIMILFIFFLWTIGYFMGLTQEDILETLGKRTGAFWWIFAFALIILIYSLSAVFGQSLLEAGAENVTRDAFTENVTKTLFNQKVLGMVLILIIASFTIRFMTTPEK